MGEHHVPLSINQDGLVTSVGNQQNKEIFETCVICGKLTDVLINTHIDYRYGYVEGCGQCCRECYDKTSGKSSSNYEKEIMWKRTTHVTISLETIFDTPNDSELGEKVRAIAWDTYRGINSSNKKNNWVCSICGKDTSEVDYDYLLGTNHISCELEKNQE